jgi:uncharacterized alpha-E superfamily protein
VGIPDLHLQSVAPTSDNRWQVLDVGRMVERVVENAAAVAAEAASRQARGVRVISSQPAWRTTLAAGMATDAAAQSSGQTATSAEQLDAIMSVCSTSGGCPFP